MAAVTNEVQQAQARVVAADAEFRSAQQALNDALQRGDAVGAAQAQVRVARAQTELVSATRALGDAQMSTPADTSGGNGPAMYPPPDIGGGGPPSLPPDDLGGGGSGGGVYLPGEYPVGPVINGGGGSLPAPSAGPGGGSTRTDETMVLGALRQMRNDVDNVPVRYEPSLPAPVMAQGYLGVLLDVGSWLLSSGQGQRAQEWFMQWLHEDAEPVFDRVAAGNGMIANTNNCDFLYKKMSGPEKAALEAWWQRNTCPIAADFLEGTARNLYLLIQMSHSSPPPSCGCAVKDGATNSVLQAHHGTIRR